MQITHEGADDTELRDLVGEAKTADESLDFEAQERRIEAVRLAIQGYEKMPQTDLISAAASIERYILEGYTAPEKPETEPAQQVGARAFVDDGPDGYKAV